MSRRRPATSRRKLTSFGKRSSTSLRTTRLRCLLFVGLSPELCCDAILANPGPMKSVPRDRRVPVERADVRNVHTIVILLKRRTRRSPRPVQAPGSRFLCSLAHISARCTCPTETRVSVRRIGGIDWNGGRMLHQKRDTKNTPRRQVVGTTLSALDPRRRDGVISRGGTAGFRRPTRK